MDGNAQSAVTRGRTGRRICCVSRAKEHRQSFLIGGDAGPGAYSATQLGARLRAHCQRPRRIAQPFRESNAAVYGIWRTCRNPSCAFHREANLPAIVEETEARMRVVAKRRAWREWFISLSQNGTLIAVSFLLIALSRQASAEGFALDRFHP